MISKRFFRPLRTTQEEISRVVRKLRTDQMGQAMAEYVILVSVVITAMIGFYFSMREAVQIYHSYATHILCLPFP
tara:strand:+ start:1286 stop:1510 length:225 start_codon:yes stop_codon:yes gene_type:complete